MNMPAPITKPYSLSHAGAVRAFDSPSTRGVWLEAESGQMLRHSPGTTSHRSGSAGMTPFHSTYEGVVGHDDERHARGRSRPSSVTTRIACHVPTDSRAGICV